jgi:hypothetical protein
MAKKAKTVEIPKVIYTQQFLKFVANNVRSFRESNGFGRWLVEYQRMDEQGWFKPEKLRGLYIQILKGNFSYSFIIKCAVNYICSPALDAAKAFEKMNSFDIVVITGEIAINDDDEELRDLSLEEAIQICEAMNDEAEEILFRVRNSITGRYESVC